MSVTVDIVETSELGDRSYIAHDGQSAIVVDPQRDLDRVESVLAELSLRCEAVLETHIHNDYVTGGLELPSLPRSRETA
jgi:hydroxyacylglutathione hydrolase